MAFEANSSLHREPATPSGVRLLAAVLAIAVGLALVWAGNSVDQQSRPQQVADPSQARSAEEARAALNQLSAQAAPRDDGSSALIWAGWGIVGITVIVMVIGVVGEAGRQAGARRDAA